jgi:hypothetical protein
MQTKLSFTCLTLKPTYAYFIDIVPKAPKNKFGCIERPAYACADQLTMPAQLDLQNSWGSQFARGL